MNSTLQQALELFIQHPEDPRVNFLLGYEYDTRGQIAAALSLYLRTAETTHSKDLQYECLIRNYLNISKQHSRDASATGQLYHAMSILPNRPEAHFLLSVYYERNKKWQESYTAACVGLEFIKQEHKPLVTDVGYPGEYGLYFQKAVAAWWIGKCDEARTLLRWIMDNYSMSKSFAASCRKNLIQIKGNIYPTTLYTEKQYPELVHKFNGAKKIKVNHAQTYQDMFVLTMLNGKKKGTYLEIGSGDPFYKNNTALLEVDFGWKGVSIDYEQKEVESFNNQRKNPAYCLDATQIDFKSFLKTSELGSDIDYLQLDCDPPNITYGVLQAIPFDLYRFAVITYEHDQYFEDEFNPDLQETFRDLSRKYLEDKGYVMVVGDISADKNSSYEDWWVHPELVDAKILKKMQNLTEGTKKAEDYMLGKL